MVSALETRASYKCIQVMFFLFQTLLPCLVWDWPRIFETDWANTLWYWGCCTNVVHGPYHLRVFHRRSRGWLALAPHSLNMFSCLILAVATAVLNALCRLKPEPPPLTLSLISSKPRCLLWRQRRTHSLKEIESPFSQENQRRHSV